MQPVRFYEIPDCRMVSTPVGQFGQEAFERFEAWMQTQTRGIFPRDFLTWDPVKQGFRWLFLYEEGMEIPEPLEVIDFKGGLYAVATDIDMQTDKPALDALVQAFVTQHGMELDHTRTQMGNVITPPAVREILGFEQMDYYYPVKPI